MNKKLPIIIIPMSGYGERFREAGYSLPKPLIKVDGVPIIHRVIELFGSENEFIFICNSDHLINPEYDMQNVIKSKVPDAKVIGIEPHSLGPSWAISQVLDFIDDNRQVIVNYCDFFCLWNYQSFLRFAEEYGPDGIIPAYKDFHPHSLGDTNYAYLENNGLSVTNIREKEPFTQNKINEYASTGTYYYKTGKLLKACLRYQFDNVVKKNNEYYASLSYQYMFENNMQVHLYPIKRFMQWGTPQDLEEYLYWSSYFKKRTSIPTFIENPQNDFGELIILASGLGARFLEKGYKKIKPLIEVNGTTMIQSIMTNYNEYFRINICERKDTNIRDQLPNASGEILTLQSLTKGQSQSALQAVEKLTSSKKIDYDTPITIATCDSDIVPDWKQLSDYLSEKVDLLVWTTDHYVYAHKNPSAYGWVICEDDSITKAFVKMMPAGEARLITGNFTFRNAAILNKIICYQQENNICTNNEFYLDDCVNIAKKLGFIVKKLDIERFASWGTPDELKTYQYWQSAFSTWAGHPYSVIKDKVLDGECKIKLESEVKKLEVEIYGSAS